jgi:PAS domain S-box-containing protein
MDGGGSVPARIKMANAPVSSCPLFFRQLVENIREVLWVLSPDFSRLVYVSPAYERVWGESCERLAQDPMSWMDQIHPADLEAVRRFCEKAASGAIGDDAFPAFRIVRPSGEIRWIQARMFAIQDSGDAAELKAIVAQDVTRSRFYEAALRESEEKWRSLTENSPDQVLLIDLHGHIYFANGDFLGQKKSDLMDRHVLGNIPTAFRTVVRSCLKQVMQAEVPGSCHIERVQADGGMTYHDLRMCPVWVNRQNAAVAIHATDVTRRVQQERTLLESEVFHRTLFEESPIGIVIQNFSGIEAPLKRLRAAGVKDLRDYLLGHPDEVVQLARHVRIIQVNQATADLYRAPGPEQMVGPLHKTFLQNDHQHFIDQVIAFSSGQDCYEGEARNRDYTGNPLDLMIRKVVINRSENGLSKVLATLIDITPMKAAEKDRSVLMLQLQQAQKMEAIGTLAGGVAHDFNNILSIILGNAELSMADIDRRHPAHRHVEEIGKACLRAKEIVQQLLGFSRKSEQQYEPIHLLPLVKEALTFMRAAIPATIDIQSALSAADDIIRADATQVHQIMINLMTNASHAMEETGGSLSVQVDNVTLASTLQDVVLPVPAGRYVRIVVGDTGKGIPEETIGRIFDPYFTTKAFGKGTGMGLAVVHGIIQNYAGGIALSSRPGEGTRFTLYLPVVDDTADHLPTEQTDLAGGKERILFVDDEAMITEVAEAILTRLGYRVDACTDSAEALSRLTAAQGQIHLLITDMSMPKMTGEELIRRVHRTCPTLPVILCTGYSDRVQHMNPTDFGIAEVLSKPVGMRVLAQTVRKVLDRFGNGRYDDADGGGRVKGDDQDG